MPGLKTAMEIKTLAIGVVFAGVGFVLAGSGSLHAYAAHRRAVDLQPVTCVILAKRITHGIGEHTWGKHSSTPYEAWARVRYSVGGVSHEAAGDMFSGNLTESGRPPSEVLTSMPVGSSQPAWVDPGEPGTVLLSRDRDTAASYLLMIIGGGVFALRRLGLHRGDDGGTQAGGETEKKIEQESKGMKTKPLLDAYLEIVQDGDRLYIRSSVAHLILAGVLLLMFSTVGVGLPYVMFTRESTGWHFSGEAAGAMQSWSEHSATDHAITFAFILVLCVPAVVFPLLVIVSVLRGRYVPWIVDRGQGVILRGSKTWRLDDIRCVTVTDSWSWFPGFRVAISFRSPELKLVTIHRFTKPRHGTLQQTSQDAYDLASAINRFANLSPSGD